MEPTGDSEFTLVVPTKGSGVKGVGARVTAKGKIAVGVKEHEAVGQAAFHLSDGE